MSSQNVFNICTILSSCHDLVSRNWEYKVKNHTIGWYSLFSAKYHNFCLSMSLLSLTRKYRIKMENNGPPNLWCMFLILRFMFQCILTQKSSGTATEMRPLVCIKMLSFNSIIIFPRCLEWKIVKSSKSIWAYFYRKLCSINSIHSYYNFRTQKLLNSIVWHSFMSCVCVQCVWVCSLSIFNYLIECVR